MRERKAAETSNKSRTIMIIIYLYNDKAKKEKDGDGMRGGDAIVSPGRHMRDEGEAISESRYAFRGESVCVREYNIYIYI